MAKIRLNKKLEKMYEHHEEMMDCIESAEEEVGLKKFEEETEKKEEQLKKAAFAIAVAKMKMKGYGKNKNEEGY
jgi:hypothetical protein